MMPITLTLLGQCSVPLATGREACGQRHPWPPSSSGSWLWSRSPAPLLSSQLDSQLPGNDTGTFCHCKHIYVHCQPNHRYTCIYMCWEVYMYLYLLRGRSTAKYIYWLEDIPKLCFDPSLSPVSVMDGLHHHTHNHGLVTFLCRCTMVGNY